MREYERLRRRREVSMRTRAAHRPPTFASVKVGNEGALERETKTAGEGKRRGGKRVTSYDMRQGNREQDVGRKLDFHIIPDEVLYMYAQ